MSIVDTYNEALKSYYPLVKSLSEYPERYEGEHPELKPFFDRSLSAALTQVDLTIGLKFLILNFTDGKHIEANYFARALAVTGYDILLNSSKLLGSEINIFVREHLPFSDNYNKALGYVKTINRFRGEDERFLKEIRNNVFGHKDEDALKQFQIVNKLDINRVNKICYEIYTANYELLGCLLHLSNEIEEYLVKE